MGNRIQILVSAVNKDAKTLPETMNLQSDAVIVDQIIGDEYREKIHFSGDRKSVV